MRIDEGEIKSIVCNFCHKEKSIDNFYIRKKDNYIIKKCKECYEAYRKEYVENNREKVRAGKKIDNNKPHRLAQRMKWNKIMIENGTRQAWLENNKDKLSAYGKKHRAEKTHAFSKEEWELCLEYFCYSCAYCGISMEEHKKIHNQVLHKEHAIDDGSNHIDNCVPSCKVCNSRKNYLDYDQWYIEGNPVFDEGRLSKIIKWLNEDWKFANIDNVVNNK